MLYPRSRTERFDQASRFRGRRSGSCGRARRRRPLSSCPRPRRTGPGAAGASEARAASRSRATPFATSARVCLPPASSRRLPRALPPLPPLWLRPPAPLCRQPYPAATRPPSPWGLLSRCVTDVCFSLVFPLPRTAFAPFFIKSPPPPPPPPPLALSFIRQVRAGAWVLRGAGFRA